MDRNQHRPSLRSRLQGTPRCRRCGHLSPCPPAVERGRRELGEAIEAGERAAAVGRLIELGSATFTERDLRGNTGRRWE